MKRNISRIFALLLSFAIIFGAVPVVGASAADDLTLTYDFIGDEASVAGFAQGLITINPSATSATSGYYLVYYTDGTNVLGGYDELASAQITGDSVRIEIKDGTFIPQGAKGIAVFESTTSFLDNAPAISTAKAKCAIPASKQLTLNGAELVFGLASDVHMNYEGTGAGAHKKWENALKFFKDQGATHIVVAGDMTGDASDGTSLGEAFTLENQYKKYMELVTAAGYTKDTAIECLGNHSNTTADRGLFTTYTAGSNEVHPFAGSGYYYVLLDGKNGAKDNLFIALQQELDAAESGYKASESANVDNFSQAQMDWFEGLLETYGNDPNTNVFVLCHSPFRNYGAGEKYNGTYSSVLTFKDEYPQNMRLKHLLETYKDITVFSGHTHTSLYQGLNYSDMGNTFAHTVHAPSTAAPRAYKNGTNTAWYDTRKGTDATYGSESYVVRVYSDYVVYMGYNVSTGKYIPQGCLIVPTKRAATPSPDDIFEGSGTANDPYLIQDEGDFLALTNGMNSATSEANKYADGKYFKQTANIDMSGIESYIGTHANGGTYGTGDARCYFGGNYDGNGYEIKVTIHGPDQRSVFPYCYGTITNVVIRGDIISENAAQPIRANRGNLINCIFDCYLDAYMTNGAVYSNYFYVYNVYTAGMMKGTSKNPFASYSAGDAYVWNVFHNFVESGGGAITSSIVGTYSNNLVQIAESMNIRKDVDYTSAADIISPSLMSKAGVILGSLKLGHNGNAPIMEDVPTSGNIAKYGNYTLSQLYRQGGQDVDWGWDITAPITYPDENGLTMIDGILASEAKYSDPAWIGFHSKAPDYVKNGYHSITFNYDVDVSVQTINVFVGTSELQQGIKAPDTIEILCDGVSVATVTPADAATESGLATEKVVIDVNKTGKTFELRFTNYAWVFVSEVQLMAYQPQVHSCAPDGSGWKSDSNGHWKVCSCGEKLNSTSHTAGSWVTVTQADVDKEGKKELRCSVCNYLMDTETIPATHAPATNNWYNNENQHWQTCGCGEKLNTAPHDDGKWVVTKKAEIGVDGKKELRCTVCDYLLKTETIPAITEDHVHSPEDRWSYDADSHWQYCECGEEMNDSAHVEGDWVIVKDAEIGVQGEKAVYCEICEYKIKSETIPALKDDTPVKPPVDDPVIPPSGGDETPEPEFMLGDINDNDKIDMTDYILLKRAYFGTYKFTEIQNLAGDINQNNKIDMTDYILLKRVYFGTYTIK